MPQEKTQVHRGVQFFVMIIIPLIAFWTGWNLSEKVTLSETVREENAIGGSAQGDQEEGTDEDAEELLIDTVPLYEALGTIEERYHELNPISQEALQEGLIRGIVSSVEDPYTSYLTPQEYTDFSQELQGELEGIGAELTVRNNVITVVSPLPDSPAQRGGLEAQDIIIGVDGEDADAQEFLSVIDRIKGPAGTPVTLEVFRPRISDTVTLELIREKIEIKSVVREELDGGVQHIRLRQFGTETVAEFREAVQTAQEAGSGVVLDLRNNPGGLLDAGVNVVAAVVPKGTKVVTQQERPPVVRNLFTRTDPISTDIPLVVLVNAGSASASEIVAGAFQDLDRALVMGEQTFGKGTVQEIVPLATGGSLKVTVAEWLTPDNRSIEEEGITPDIIIERTLEDRDADEDPQLEAAVMLLNGATQETVTELYGAPESDLEKAIQESQGE